MQRYIFVSILEIKVDFPDSAKDLSENDYGKVPSQEAVSKELDELDVNVNVVYNVQAIKWAYDEILQNKNHSLFISLQLGKLRKQNLLFLYFII